jgi:hypothetical protein
MRDGDCTITASKFYGWRERYGRVNVHNGWVPRDFWLEDWEEQIPPFEEGIYPNRGGIKGSTQHPFQVLSAGISMA